MGSQPSKPTNNPPPSTAKGLTEGSVIAPTAILDPFTLKTAAFSPPSEPDAQKPVDTGDESRQKTPTIQHAETPGATPLTEPRSRRRYPPPAIGKEFKSILPDASRTLSPPKARQNGSPTSNYHVSPTTMRGKFPSIPSFESGTFDSRTSSSRTTPLRPWPDRASPPRIRNVFFQEQTADSTKAPKSGPSPTS